MFKSEYLNRVYSDVSARNAGESEFLQAVRDVLESLEPVIAQNPKFHYMLEDYDIQEKKILSKYKVD